MKVERSDLEAKLQEIQDVVDETREAAKSPVVLIAVGVVVVVAVAFLMGRRKGKKAGKTRVEVYRIKG